MSNKVENKKSFLDIYKDEQYKREETINQIFEENKDDLL